MVVALEGHDLEGRRSVEGGVERVLHELVDGLLGVANGEGRTGCESLRDLALRNTGIVNYLGLCALTVPVALDKAGMPVGLQLIAQHGQEERLLSIGLALENTLGDGRSRLGSPSMVKNEK